MLAHDSLIKRNATYQSHGPDHLAQRYLANEIHYQNASCEIPAMCLYKAVQQAQEFKYSKKAETHPAIRTLCQWWNDMAPAPEARIAAQIKLYVRYPDKNLYVSGLTDRPLVAIDDMWRAESKSACARWSDWMLIEFGQSRAANFYQRHSIQAFNVVGLPFLSADDIDPKEAKTWDFAQEGLESLKLFPECYPCIWEKLLADI